MLDEVPLELELEISFTLSNYLFSASYVPRVFLVTGDTVVDTTNMVSAFILWVETEKKKTK